nr:SCO3374 family protein [Streptomyces cavernae]
MRQWYENELGWPTVPGLPLRLRTGLSFDVLDVPAEAGRAALRHLTPGSPVALRADRMLLLVAAGSAEDLPGLLDWLEWGSLGPDIRAVGTDGHIAAPPPRGLPGTPGAGRSPGALGNAGRGTSGDPRTSGTPGSPGSPGTRATTPGTQKPGSQGAAVWLRPPEPGCEVERVLPTLSALGSDGGAAAGPSLVRLVDTVATQCHRIRLRGAGDDQPLACS